MWVSFSIQERGRAWKSWAWAISERSSWGRDLGHAESLLLHQVDWVGIGAPIILWVIVLSVLDQCTACSCQIGTCDWEEKGGMSTICHAIYFPRHPYLRSFDSILPDPGRWLAPFPRFRSNPNPYSSPRSGTLSSRLHLQFPPLSYFPYSNIPHSHTPDSISNSKIFPTLHPFFLSHCFLPNSTIHVACIYFLSP